MFKKHRILLTLVIILLLTSNVVQAAESYIDKSNLNNGIVKINNSGNIGAVRVSKGSTSYDYILNGSDTIPLQLGNGDYTILVLENAGGNKYKQAAKEVVTLKASNTNEVYLQSVQNINWNDDMNAIKKAKELTKNAKNDKEKVEAIYNYIVTNIKYDYDKASKVSSGYKPNIDETMKSQKGICYDYSALFAAMLRSEGIPAKLVMGRNSNIKEYHAWNQVYLADSNEWITIDTTYDAALKKADVAVKMIKDASEFKVEKEF